MQPAPQKAPVSKGKIWTGYVLTALTALFLLFSAGVKLLGLTVAIEGTVRLGYPAELVLVIGIAELACTVIYLIPRTAVLGAILVTGYLGGATATHVRVGDPFFFPILLGMVAWAGVWLRDERLRGLIPLRK